VPVKPQFARIC